MLNKGGIIGIVGGGQLAKLLSMESKKLGYETHILCDNLDFPAKNDANTYTIANYHDNEKTKAFADKVDVITYEFENLPYETLDYLSQLKKVYPSPEILKITQNRIREKEFLEKINIKTSAFFPILSKDGINDCIKKISNYPLVIKTAKSGYDGKGQKTLKNEKDIYAAWSALGKVPCIIEQFINFQCEISVIAVRDINGKIECFEPIENIHKNHILDTSTVPAAITKTVASNAETIAKKIAQKLEYVGTMCVEFFVDKNQNVLVNEIAPRVHNSGHLTIEAFNTNQFEQHLRAVANIPLKSIERINKAKMKNIIGLDVEEFAKKIDKTNATIYNYGKTEVRANRKMGHVTYIS